MRVLAVISSVRSAVLAAALVCGPGAASGAEAIVAVASNFLTTAERLAHDFTVATGHDIALVHGSTGKLFAQIRAGAPFDVFLAADFARPERLAAEGYAAESGPAVYAIGELALVARDGLPGGSDATLRDVQLRLAIADPATAPYGAAAAEVLAAARGPGWRAGVVLGESVGQAFAFVATGNAPAGLVARSQTVDLPSGLTATPIAPDRHTPIRQGAVLLARGGENPAARAFYAYLLGEDGRALIRAAGYAVPE